MKRHFQNILDLVRIGAGFAVLGIIARWLRPFHLIWIAGIVVSVAAALGMVILALWD